MKRRGWNREPPDGVEAHRRWSRRQQRTLGRQRASQQRRAGLPLEKSNPINLFF